MTSHITRFVQLLCALAITTSCVSQQYPGKESRYESFAPDGIEFRVAKEKWDVDMRGNHRAIVKVKDSSEEAVLVNIPWRRPDRRIESKKIVVTDTAGNEIEDVAVTLMSSEKGQIVFRPKNGVSDYYVYYLAARFRHSYDDMRYKKKPWIDYLEPEYKADSAWAASAVAMAAELPEATVECFESVSKFNFWSPMGLIATGEETEAIKEAVGKDMIVFPEDRAFPIELKDALPCKWNKVPLTEFRGKAQRNEYYAWQLGVWAAGKSLENVKVKFSDLKNGGSTIPASEMTCFNQEGTNWDGKHLEFRIDVPESKVQALWCGVQIPENAKPGTYKGQATVIADNAEAQTIELAIRVGARVLADKGDSEQWRHGRLRWLNSTIAMDNEPTAQYKEMVLEGNTIEATGKTVKVGANGLVESIVIKDKEILAAPQKFIVTTSGGDVVFSADNVSINKEAAGLISWKASSDQQGIHFDLSAEMEFDGNIHYDLNVSSEGGVEAKDVKLVTKYTPYSSEYAIGCGFFGGYRPVDYTWCWDGPYDSYWIGGVHAGLHTEFRGGTYHGPLLKDYRPAPTPVWSNGGLGKVAFSGATGSEATVVASTGKKSFSSKAEDYEFSLLITPVKEINTSDHFNTRYYHSPYTGFDEAAKEGCNVANIHHAQALNPYINYPYIVRDSLVRFINHEHEFGRKVKLYYTVRELSTLCEEIYAFNSLNHEIFDPGIGYGIPWMCEHLIDDYRGAWYTSNEWLSGLEPDAAIVLIPNSRYINYWLEGLRWMVENYGIDGIYMDDVSFDRITTKRIRKILDRYHDGGLVDLHSNLWYSVGPTNQYTEYFPYINRLWFGESYHYDQMTPDEWLVVFSGIPFGQMAEMLEKGGNRFLGMVYGATARYRISDFNTVKSPAPVWKLWDEFGIADAKMVGYWEAECAVSASDPEVKVTTYVKEDKVLLAVGNFSTSDKTVTLDIDWNALGMDADKTSVEVPEIKDFQSQTSLKPGEPIDIKAKEGRLIILRK